MAAPTYCDISLSFLGSILSFSSKNLICCLNRSDLDRFSLGDPFGREGWLWRILSTGSRLFGSIPKISRFLWSWVALVSNIKLLLFCLWSKILGGPISKCSSWTLAGHTYSHVHILQGRRFADSNTHTGSLSWLIPGFLLLKVPTT